MPLPCVLIPAYKPDDKLIELIEELKAGGFHRILVVDDGGGEAYAALFARAADLGCTVLKHSINMGKGRALKTGINHGLAAGLLDDGVITADADGQHTPADIRRIAESMAVNPGALVLGVRHFTGSVPLRSRFGNEITRFFFMLIHGSDVRDTQTGLRGLPPGHLPLLLALPGERYEYEMNMLLALRPNEIPVELVPIETIYIEGNRSSHFNTLRDSARIYRLLFKFIASSLLSTGLDYLIFALMNILVPNQLIGSVLVARAGSSIVNYAINKHVVFKRKGSHRQSLARYYALAGFVVVASYLLIKLFNLRLGLDLYLSKVIADIILYAVSFIVQREFVYKNKTS